MRRVISGLAIVGCALALTLVRQSTGGLLFSPGAVQAQGALPADAFQMLGTRPVKDFKAAALSPDGTALGILNGDGMLSLWSRPAWCGGNGKKPLWRQPVPGAAQLILSAGAAHVLTYAPLDPTRKTLTILRGKDGAFLARNTLQGAVWDAQMSGDGCYASVVTGDRSLYMYQLGNFPRYHRWSLDGIGNSVAMTRNSSYVATGTWDGSGVACYTLRGAVLWQYPNDPDVRRALSNRIFEAQVAADGQYVLGLSYANVHQSDGILYLWRSSGSGRPLWKYDLGLDALSPRAQITADGQFVAVTYQRLITRGDQSVAERRLLVLDRQGNVVCDRSGLFSSPSLISLAPDGHRMTVSDGQRTLYNLNAAGRITAAYSLPGQFRQAVATPDGRFLLVYTGDGTVSLFQLS